MDRFLLKHGYITVCFVTNIYLFLSSLYKSGSFFSAYRTHSMDASYQYTDGVTWSVCVLVSTASPMQKRLSRLRCGSGCHCPTLGRNDPTCNQKQLNQKIHILVGAGSRNGKGHFRVEPCADVSISAAARRVILTAAAARRSIFFGGGGVSKILAAAAAAPA